jgi:hypothetical protein
MLAGVAQGGLQSEDMPTQEELPIKNGVLYYKQFVRPMTDYSYPTCKSSACTHVQELQVLQSKCHHGATNALAALVTGKPVRIWGFRSSPTESFDSKFADAGIP